ncbi:efflux RND transporter periplasmic adaptor subunit [Enterobacteriaceae bacterium RIT714]|nr:efflux RND transporter periplasmic adaptor subunit [Enterobacteriaceae bacterium RIT714]
MKTLTFTAVALAVLLAAGAGYFLGQRHAPSAPETVQPVGRKVLYWYDPMMPGQRFDKPGKSPFMDMELVARYADEEKPDAGVGISARQQQNLGMKTAKAQKRQLAQPFTAYATVSTNERNLMTVPAPGAGVISKLYVRAQQQQVNVGEPLAEIWLPQWTAAQQEYLAMRQLGDPELTRAARERLALQFMPEETIRALERSGKPQTRLTLRAEKAGYIAKLDVQQGAQVAANTPLFDIATLESIWLVVDYPQTQAQSLAVGDEMVATSESWPGVTFHGTVSELLPQMETTTRTFKARIVLDNPQFRLKPGMFLTVNRAGQTRGASVLAVPEESVINSGDAQRLLLASGEGFFRPVKVTTGITSAGWTEITSGIQEGDTVVTSGQFLIDSEASLRSALPEVTK